MSDTPPRPSQADTRSRIDAEVACTDAPRADESRTEEKLHTTLTVEVEDNPSHEDVPPATAHMWERLATGLRDLCTTKCFA